MRRSGVSVRCWRAFAGDRGGCREAAPAARGVVAGVAGDAPEADRRREHLGGLGGVADHAGDPVGVVGVHRGVDQHRHPDRHEAEAGGLPAGGGEVEDRHCDAVKAEGCRVRRSSPRRRRPRVSRGQGCRHRWWSGSRTSSRCGTAVAEPISPAGKVTPVLRGRAGWATLIWPGRRVVPLWGPELNCTVLVHWKGWAPAWVASPPPSSSALTEKCSRPKGTGSELTRIGWRRSLREPGGDRDPPRPTARSGPRWRSCRPSARRGLRLRSLRRRAGSSHRCSGPPGWRAARS